MSWSVSQFFDDFRLLGEWRTSSRNEIVDKAERLIQLYEGILDSLQIYCSLFEMNIELDRQKSEGREMVESFVSMVFEQLERELSTTDAD